MCSVKLSQETKPSSKQAQISGQEETVSGSGQRKSSSSRTKDCRFECRGLIKWLWLDAMAGLHLLFT